MGSLAEETLELGRRLAEAAADGGRRRELLWEAMGKAGAARELHGGL
jgi:hypothetical protein